MQLHADGDGKLWHGAGLFLHTLDSFTGLEALVRKYFVDHNELIPRVELRGRTPDEAYRGEKVGLAERLGCEHAEARVRRVAENRARTCRTCEPAQHAPPTPTLSLVP